MAIKMSEDLSWSEPDYEKYEIEKPADRLNFIRKVYSILTLQLLITTIFVVVSAVTESYQDFVISHIWLFILSIVLSIIVLLILFFVKELHRRVPYNYILLFTFTILEAFTISCITAFYDPETIALAAGCTAGLTLVLTLYAIFTKTDFTMAWGIMISLSFGLLVFGIIFIFIGSSDLYRLIFCPIAIAIYGIFLVYDTQLIVGEKRHKIGYDDYVLGSVALYIDIVGIFLYMLQFLDGK